MRRRAIVEVFVDIERSQLLVDGFEDEVLFLGVGVGQGRCLRRRDAGMVSRVPLGFRRQTRERESRRLRVFA